MSFSYGTVARQVDNILGTIVGATVATTESNYTATPSTSNRNNPDFPLTAVQDAVLNAISYFVLAIAETPRHPERNAFRGITAPLVNLSLVPPTDALAQPFIGVKGDVYDADDEKVLLPMPVGKVRSYNQFPSIYTALGDVYWYACSGQSIVHTRPAVIIEGVVWERPSFVSVNPVPLSDIHENPIVMNAVMELAPREGLYLEVWNAAKTISDAHLERIRRLGAPEANTAAQGAPSNT